MEHRAPYRSRDEWLELFAEQERSDLSQRSFCESRGILLSTYRNARKRHGSAEPRSDASDDVGGFLALEVSAPEAPAGRHWDLELELGTGIVLRIRRR